MPRQSSLRVVLLQENVEYYQGIKGGRRAGMTGGQWLPHRFTAHMYWLLNILQSGISNKYFSEGAESWKNVSTFVLSLLLCHLSMLLQVKMKNSLCSEQTGGHYGHCILCKIQVSLNRLFLTFNHISCFFSLLTNFNWHDVCCINQK